MGIEVDVFVNAVSPSLICTICHGVVDSPVLTPTECLYCEECLLDWMQRSPTCPSTQVALNPEDIKKPSRLVMNILAELVRYCDHKTEVKPRMHSARSLKQVSSLPIPSHPTISLPGMSMARELRNVRGTS